jgi:hypothetical protein
MAACWHKTTASQVAVAAQTAVRAVLVVRVVRAGQRAVQMAVGLPEACEGNMTSSQIGSI